MIRLSQVLGLITSLGEKLVKASNLSDLTSVADARDNLGLGNAATKNVGTGTNDVAQGSHLHTGVYAPNSHVSSTSNPHSVTKSQVGLGNVTNDAQMKKIASSTMGNIPKWGTTGGDRLDDGYGVETSITGSASKLATAAAIKAYVDNNIGANDAMVYKGVIDCSSNPDYPAGDAGDAYKVSVAGKIGGSSGPNVEVGDMIICTVDGSSNGTHATVGANWNIIQVNIDGAVTGPASASDGFLVEFDGTSGKVIKVSSKRVGDLQNKLTAKQSIVTGESGNANTVINIPGAFSEGTPASSVPVVVAVNGLMIPKGDPATTTDRWSNSATSLSIKLPYALETSDEITLLYSV